MVITQSLIHAEHDPGDCRVIVAGVSEGILRDVNQLINVAGEVG